MRNPLLLIIVVFSTHASPICADSHFDIVKVWAGVGEARSKMEKEARLQARKGVIISDVSEVACNTKNFRIGVAFYVRPQQASFVSVDYTWYYQALDNKGPSKEFTRSEIYRKSPSESHRIKYEEIGIGNEYLQDSDVAFVIHKNGRLFLRHTFKIRGCDKKG